MTLLSNFRVCIGWNRYMMSTKRHATWQYNKSRAIMSTKYDSLWLTQSLIILLINNISHVRKEIASRIWPTAQMTGSILSTITSRSTSLFLNEGLANALKQRCAIQHLVEQKNIILAVGNGGKTGERTCWNYSAELEIEARKSEVGSI